MVRGQRGKSGQAVVDGRAHGVQLFRPQLDELAAAAEGLLRSCPPEQRDAVAACLLEELRERVRAACGESPPVRPELPAVPSANPFALAIPLGVAGGVLLVLFPPVGLVLMGSALLAMVGGLVAALLRGRGAPG